MAGPQIKTREQLQEKIRSRVVIDPDSGCWLWQGFIDWGGYGHATVTNAIRKPGEKYWDGAHRVSYRAFVGEIPDDREIDHLCRTRCCVNPAHLEVVTKRVNTLRGTSNAAKNAVKTHCVKGHEFTPENTYVQRRKGKVIGRGCRKCANAATIAWYYKNKERTSGNALEETHMNPNERCVACGTEYQDHIMSSHKFQPDEDGRIAQWAIDAQHERLRPFLNVYAKKTWREQHGKS